ERHVRPSQKPLVVRIAGWAGDAVEGDDGRGDGEGERTPLAREEKHGERKAGGDDERGLNEHRKGECDGQRPTPALSGAEGANGQRRPQNREREYRLEKVMIDRADPRRRHQERRCGERRPGDDRGERAERTDRKSVV